jgi:hypothetical protein
VNGSEAWLGRWVVGERSALIVQSALVGCVCTAGQGRQDRGRSVVCGILVGPCGLNLHGVGDRECGRR